MILNTSVTTNAAKEEVQMKGGAIKVKVTAKPVDGEANKAVVKLLASHLNTKENKVKIIRGSKSRKKVVEVILPS